MTRKQQILTAVSAAALHTFGGVGFAHAQTVSQTDSTPPMLGEVIVTARKTTESLQKAPASIVAVTGVELRRAGVTDTQSLEALLPSGNLRSEGATVEAFIRGVGSVQDGPNTSPDVVFVYNGIVVPRFGTQGLLFDVADVQTIAGPQGTLYGGTAAGGAINVNSVKPQNNLSGDGSLEVGSYGTAFASLGQNMPLGDDVSVRAAIDYRHHDGYETGGFFAENKLQGRLSLLVKPTDDFTALVFFSGSYDNGLPPNTVNKPLLNPSNPWYTPAAGAIFGNPYSSNTTFQQLGTYVVGANFEWRVGDNVFTYIPGYVQVDTNYRNFTASFPLHNSEHLDQDSQELRWSREQGALKFNAGLFYLHSTDGFTEILSEPVSPIPPYLVPTAITTIKAQENTSYSAFGQVVYSVTDKLRVTGGARISRDEIKADGDGTLGFSYVPYTFRHTKDHQDYKVGIDYDLRKSILLYINFQTGYIPFGFAPVPSNTSASNYLPESNLLGYSGGFKSRLFDDRVQINNELYYYDYYDFQALYFNAANGTTTNLPAQRSAIYGDELTVQISLPYRVKFDTGMNLMSAHYVQFTGPGYNYTGNQMIDAPEANVMAGLQKSVSIGDWGDMVGRVQGHYNSGYWGDYQHFVGTYQPAYATGDLSITFTPSRGNWSAQAYVDNVSNTAIYGALVNAGQPGPASGFLEPPRTYGLRVFAKWN